MLSAGEWGRQGEGSSGQRQQEGSKHGQVTAEGGKCLLHALQRPKKVFIAGWFL